MKRGILWAVVASLVGIGGAWSVHAATFVSPNFSINGNIGDSAAGGQNSTNYQLTSAAGESIAGNSASKSYKLGQGYLPTLENSLQLNVQSNGLVGHYPLDENQGAVATDESSNSTNGTFVGTPSWTTGQLGSSLTFNGTTDRLDIPHSSATNFDTGTISFWMKTSQVAADERSILEKRDSTNYPYVFRLQVNGKLQFAAYDGTSYVFDVSQAALNNGNWYFVTGVRQTGGTMRLYINGVEDGTTADFPVAGGSPNTANIYVGARGDGTRGFNGQVDDIKLYNRVLSPQEIAAAYQAGLSGATAGIGIQPVNPGTSQSSPFDTIIQTSAPGYSLAINQNNNLSTGGGPTISPVSGTIASPVSWNEGSTKGLGFTLYNTNATALPGSWGGGANYASLPLSGTSFYTRTGYTAGTKDVLNMRLRLDVPPSQPPGDYTNRMTITGTMTP